MSSESVELAAQDGAPNNSSNGEHLLKSLYVKALNYPKSLLSALFLLCVVLGLKIPDLDIDASSDSLILQNDPAFVAYEKMGKAYSFKGVSRCCLYTKYAAFFR
jgi:predicted RND superfamily exporter protein